MRATAAILFVIAGILFGGQRQARAQFNLGPADSQGTSHHTQVKLVLDADAFHPGQRPIALLDLKMDPGWHTYWKNPGDAGTPTKIEWTLPPGVTVVESGWPVPRKLPPVEVTTYGYEDEAVLPSVLEIASNAPPGQLTIKAHVTWLECKDVCLPASSDVEAQFEVAAAGQQINTDAEARVGNPERGRVIDLWRHSTPLPPSMFAGDVRAWWEKPSAADTRPLVIEWAGPQREVDFYPDPNDHYEIESATEMFPTADGHIGLRKSVKKFDGEWPKAVSGLLVLPHSTNFPALANDFRYIIAANVTLSVGDEMPADKLTARVSMAADQTPVNSNLTLAKEHGGLFFARIFFSAFLGGLILNIMPCVLPVIALKILGFVSEARSDRRHVRKLGLFYTLGVLASFLVLAGIVISVKAAGHQAGWGMQFSSPVFIVCLTTLVMLVALNLFGVFEVVLGSGAMNTAGQIASKSGLAGAFFNGVLATTLATPCTAPFLAPALGFAFAQNASMIASVFIAVGLGLSAPYLLLSWQPAWLKFLPKPGNWMVKFKVAMGFPMLATVIWLFNVASSSYGKNVVWLGVFLVIVAFAAWVYGDFVQRGSNHKTIAAIIALALLASGYAFALERELDWRSPVNNSTAGSLQESADGIVWQPWSPAAVAAARAAGKPVLVDFTADWCLTCQVNKKTSLEIPSVREKLKAVNAVTLIGDYTHFPEAITTELNRYDRAGVPLVLVYPQNPDSQAIVLPSILTPGIVLAALDRTK